MGLTAWSGARPSKEDSGIAKNYLNHDELDTLNRIVSFYLDFAELQAKNRRPMHMQEWIANRPSTRKSGNSDNLISSCKNSVFGGQECPPPYVSA